ncbi:putative disease resistance protein At3g14460 [Cannabis sativa]|uniref:putative disease resistance protein At3g14460 n=1 Tax=Cannabis sativa TaxID=3483 RepID=UPI0029CA205D|nr:putative disease resistance protein At3g14460 [Cannabis sativa]XP_060960346.1 putative disease resistance protein At3g14460 [Cannabis sativa]
MAELVIGAFLSASFELLLQKIASPYVEKLLLNGENESSVKERLFKLQSTFNTLAAVRFEVENKRIKNPSVEKWLDDLLDAVDDAEDFFGDIEYDAMKPNKADESKKEKRKAISKLLSCFSKPSTSTERVRNANMEEILKRLEYLANQIGILDLEKNVVEVQPSGSSRVKTSLPDEPELYGRKTDEDALMMLLMSDEDGSEKICVIPSMGGIGKTTLAQTLFNDERVKKKFESRAWVYVSDKFDSTAVTKNLLQELAPSDAGNDMTLNLLQVNLSNKLMGKKFLIVLDDVWEDDYAQWTEVMKPFNGGAKGSKIIVTTRNEKVADIIRTRTIHTHHLRELSEDECWKLFSKHASCGNPELECIGREIARKCNGLPLAAKVLGGLLRSTDNAEKWKQIANSNLWELQDKRSRSLPAALEVSYFYLPPHLKGCFAYCSIFPKGYEFKRDELVLMWMAESLVQYSKRNRRIEEVCCEYFDDLVSFSFLQPSKWGVSCFVMHDLIVDLARTISGKYSCLLEQTDSIDRLEEKTRHLGCVRELYNDNKIASYDFGATRLRTFVTILGSSSSKIGFSKAAMQNFLSMLKCLRVLSFRGLYMFEFPDSIGELKHLRYLDLSQTGIVILPEFVTKLYNLQTLKLGYYDCLQTLPKDMHHLINLRHLIIGGDNVFEMPCQISKLTNLQWLTTFVVGKDSGAKIEELAELQSLHGELSIKKLENVANITKALDQVIVLEKKQLEKLQLEWSDNVVVDPKHGEGVLEMLSPNTMLKELKINFYPGTKFPNWVGNDSFSNIVEVTLDRCKRCSYLPPFGQLPLLKHLSISGCNSVVTVGAEFYGNCSVRKPFSSLETLRFREMSSWEQWNSMQTEEATTYGKLKTLEIIGCPKFEGDLPRFLPSLIRIDIREDKQCPLLSLPRLPCVTEMFIWKLENSESLYEAIKPTNPCSTLTPLYHYPPLQHLTLSNCGSSFRSLHMDLFPNLKTLVIGSSDYFEAMTVSDGKSLEELTSLSIDSCDSFVSFSNGGLIAPKLSELKIRKCPKLKWLPEKMTSLSALKELTIRYCPLIKSFPEGEGGLPVSLCELNTSYDELLRMKWNWQTLPHLTTLFIDGDGIEEDVESFPKEGLLPTTITDLEIWSFRRLRGLDKNGLTQLTSLQVLRIFNCPELETLSEEGFPTSLTSLEIYSCPLVKKKYSRGNEEYWNKISHIPNVRIV